jgi:hypothetical protein
LRVCHQEHSHHHENSAAAGFPAAALDQGNYSDEEAGVKINIQNTAWCGTGKNVVIFTASKMYGTEFSAKILYPDVAGLIATKSLTRGK